MVDLPFILEEDGSITSEAQTMIVTLSDTDKAFCKTLAGDIVSSVLFGCMAICGVLVAIRLFWGRIS